YWKRNASLSLRKTERPLARQPLAGIQHCFGRRVLAIFRGNRIQTQSRLWPNLPDDPSATESSITPSAWSKSTPHLRSRERERTPPAACVAHIECSCRRTVRRNGRPARYNPVVPGPDQLSPDRRPTLKPQRVRDCFEATRAWHRTADYSCQ